MEQRHALRLLFLATTAWDINDGVAMSLSLVRFLNFVIAVLPVTVITLDPGDVMPGGLHTQTLATLQCLACSLSVFPSSTRSTN